MKNTKKENIELTGEAHDRLLSHQKPGEELHETLERLMLVLPMHPNPPLEEDGEFALVRAKTEDGLYRTDDYSNGYAFYKEFSRAVEGYDDG